MKTVIAVLTLAFLAIGPAAAGSATMVPPGHEKKRMYMHSARRVAPGHMKKY